MLLHPVTKILVAMKELRHYNPRQFQCLKNIRNTCSAVAVASHCALQFLISCHFYHIHGHFTQIYRMLNIFLRLWLFIVHYVEVLSEMVKSGHFRTLFCFFLIKPVCHVVTTMPRGYVDLLADRIYAVQVSMFDVLWHNSHLLKVFRSS